MFLAEGSKIVAELLESGMVVERVYALPEWCDRYSALFHQYSNLVVLVSASELESVSALHTPQQVLALVRIPELPPDVVDNSAHLFYKGGISLALDHLQDPGNMGTILRIADWFGIRRVLCSPDCVDAYNPKTIQAAMGSIARTEVVYTDLPALFSRFPDLPVCGALLHGENLYQSSFSSANGGFLLIGNESVGIRPYLHSHLTHRVTIPRLGRAESLNAAVATGILCSWLIK